MNLGENVVVEIHKEGKVILEIDGKQVAKGNAGNSAEYLNYGEILFVQLYPIEIKEEE